MPAEEASKLSAIEAAEFYERTGVVETLVLNVSAPSVPMVSPPGGLLSQSPRSVLRAFGRLTQWDAALSFLSDGKL